MSALAELELPYRRGDDVPLFVDPAADRCVLLAEGELNRAFSPDVDRCHPPDPAALARIAAILRAPRRTAWALARSTPCCTWRPCPPSATR